MPYVGLVFISSRDRFGPQLIASTSSQYEKLYTCDAGYDTGQFLSPRLLVTQDNIDHIEEVILSLGDSYVSLPGRLVIQARGS